MTEADPKSAAPAAAIAALAEAVRQLRASPADFASWLSAATHLAAAGRADDAAHAFATLGKAA
ncbi:MAG: hypothetical protein H6708_31790, partial [Kofleriaceae bacterium]|nr:hypothetical protein [Kofleriaceae bacterium]